MPPFLGLQCWSSLDDKTPFPGAKATLTCYVCAGPFCFSALKECTPDLFDVLFLTRYKTVLKTVLLWSGSSELFERLYSRL